ncbi:MAG: aldolase/citrate lyase family protein [Caldilineaceae bacterium]
MRKSKMLAKFRSGGFARVCGLGHFLPFFIRYAAHFKFDGIWLDLEHRAMDPREVQQIIALCYYNDIDCMVRPPTLERTKLYRYLEDGAAGFLMPLVSDPQMASDIVQAAKFSPIGNRGMDGAGLDGDYGIGVWVPDSTYNADANRETFIITQVETPQAVANAEEIASIEGIDGLFVGPADLTLRISNTPAGSKLDFEKAIETVAAAAQKHGKMWGITAGSVEQIKRYRSMGAQMVPWGGDFALMNVLKNASQDLDGVDGA